MKNLVRFGRVREVCVREAQGSQGVNLAIVVVVVVVVVVVRLSVAR